MVTLRKAVVSDAEAMNQLYFNVWLDTYSNQEFGVSREDLSEWLKPSLTPESLESSRSSIENKPENVLMLVAEDNDKVIGFCYASKGNGDEHNKLRAIYVDTAYQGKGVGKLLWSEANKFFNPDVKTDVQVVAYNDKAIGFYKSIGFVETGERITDDEDYRLRTGVILPLINLIK
mgnify:CR=1 FL=1